MRLGFRVRKIREHLPLQKSSFPAGQIGTPGPQIYINPAAPETGVAALRIEHRGEVK